MAGAQDVPTGAAEAVLHWVGSDLERARLALEVEGAREKPRVGLTASLEGLLADDQENDASDVPASGIVAVLPIEVPVLGPDGERLGTTFIAPGDEVTDGTFDDEELARLLADPDPAVRRV